MLELAEFVPDDKSVKELIAIAQTYNIAILADLFENDNTDQIFKTHICVDKNSVVAKYRKLHPFINPNVTPEYIRATNILGADIIFMSHVTMCTPSTRPKAGFVDRMDEDQLKYGCSMIIDLFGHIIAECRKLDNEVIIATIVPEKLTKAGGYRYKKARRPNLYRDTVGQSHNLEQKVIWLSPEEN
ncbi:unnamed protein product [Rotaria sp. Silwood1]|nr:unnamed protein product [Rotaria sp. Silwood1]